MVSVHKYITEPWRLVVSRSLSFLWPLYSDAVFIKSMYRANRGESLNLANPRTFTEKLQWLKLHDFKPEYVRMVDKYEAKQYVADKVGASYVIPTYGVWNTFDEIDWDALPSSFVLKCTHDSNSYVICRNKDELDKEAAKRRLTSHLKQNFYVFGRERPYKYIKPRIIAEAYMEDTVLHDLRDYKFFTFGGVPKVVHIVSNRQNKTEETYGDCFDMDYQPLDLSFGHANSPVLPEKPVNFERMKEFAAQLSQGTRHMRVDFYEVNGQLYFGELTFYHDAGWGEVTPPEWNQTLGDWIDISSC